MNLRDNEPIVTARDERTGASSEKPVRVWLITPDDWGEQTIRQGIGSYGCLVCERVFQTLDQALLAMGYTPPPEVLVVQMVHVRDATIRAVALVRRAAPLAKILILSEVEDACSVARTFTAGADGYVSRNAGVAEVVEAIRMLQQGDAWMSPRVARLVLQFLRNGHHAGCDQEFGLTSRENRHLQLLAQGLSKKEIASELSISFHTVDTHLRSIYRKLGVNTRSAAIAKALHAGLC